MIEDDIYRTSTQFRYWSYAQETLDGIRRSTNALASERVKAAFRRGHDAEIANGNGDKNPDEHTSPGIDIATLTVEEELKIVEWGCQKIMEIGESFSPRIPSSIVATAIQYLRRFYLTNSPMTYHPKQIMMCALYLATKADHYYISLPRFVAELPNVTEEDVKAPEFLLLQGLRFTLEVRHPMRGLSGGHAEMNAMANEGRLGQITKQTASKRIGRAADRAKKILSSAAQTTDAYFLYTPSQIWIASILMADRELIEAYLKSKFKSLPDEASAIKERVMETIESCSQLLASYKSPGDDTAQRKEMKRIGKKLTICQNPEKTDIVAVAKAKVAEKREGANGSDGEKALKKRKLEKEKLEKDGDVFGPDLKSVDT